jgi:hypothetical protein
MNDYKVDFNFEDNVLRVHLSGQFPDEMLAKPENLFKPLIDACSAYQCCKALVDASEMTANFRTIDLFRAGKDAVDLTLTGLWVAMLARKDMRDRFFDDVVANRGGHIGIFTDATEALDWLQKQE